jgi:hypothetical protein
MIKRMMLANADITVEEIRTKLRDQGLPLSRLATVEVRRAFLHDLQVLYVMGWLREGHQFFPSPGSRALARPSSASLRPSLRPSFRPSSRASLEIDEDEIEPLHGEDLKEFRRQEAYRRRRRNRPYTAYGLEHKE